MNLVFVSNQVSTSRFPKKQCMYSRKFISSKKYQNESNLTYELNRRDDISM